jgi:hypothetical protein
VEEITALLDEADEQLTYIEAAYQDSLDQHKLPGLLKVKIKNCIENQRSALDYLGRLVTERHGKGAFRFYPLAQDPNEFASLMDRNLPGVASARPDIRDVFARWQPYSEPWLRTLNQLARTNKHNTFSAQTRNEEHRREVRKAGGVVSWGQGVRFGPGVSIMGETVDPATQRTPSTVDVIYVAWFFDDPNVSVMPTLREFQSKLRDLVDDVGHVANL